jgi:hypothetical protein
MAEVLTPNENWQTISHPGYFGKRKDEMFALWNQEYGENNWRLVNETSTGEILSYEDIIGKVYVPGYVLYFINHSDEASYILKNYSYGYDKALIDKEKAFDIYAMYNQSGIANQFHNVAFNIALEYFIGPFEGDKPIQVREGKPGTPETEQPAGWKWSPGYIPAVRPDLIPQPSIAGWWKKDSIEDFYQSSKALQIKI